MVYSNEYQQIRRIFKKDVRAVMSLIRQSVHNEELMRRTRAEILERLEIIGCSRSTAPRLPALPCTSIRRMRPASSPASTSTRRTRTKDMVRKLMAFAENLAREKGLKRLFALSTQAFSYLQQKAALSKGSAEALPAERRLKYEASGRNSKILFKPVAAGIN